MHDALVAFGHSLQNTSFALAIGGSDWAYPFVQAIHFGGLSLWIGTNVALDLSLLGIGNERQSPSQLADALFVWNWMGFAVAVVGGFLLFSVAAETYLFNIAFVIKLGLLIPLALVMHIVNQRNVRAWGLTSDTPPVAKAAGVTELFLWLCVATAAVLIPYVS